MSKRGKVFKPNVNHISALHRAAEQLADKLEPYFSNIRGFKSASLFIRSPIWKLKYETDRIDMLTNGWYANYSELTQDCEVYLTTNTNAKIFTSMVDRDYCKARLTKLPGCCGVCVISKVEIHHEMRNNGIGKAFVKVLEAFARALNYSSVIATVEKFNCSAKGIVNGLGFSEASMFVNAKTKNTVMVYVKNINPGGISLTDGYDKEDQ